MEKKKRPLFLFFELLKGYRMRFFCGIFCVAVCALSQLLYPQIIQFTVDAVLTGTESAVPAFLLPLYRLVGGRGVFLDHLWLCAVLLLLAYLINSSFNFFRSILVSTASERATERLRNRLYDRLSHLPYAAHVAANTGDMLQRCSSDVETTRRFAAVQLVELSRAIFMLCFALFMMLRMDVRMTFVTLFVVPFLVGGSFIFFRSIRKTFRMVENAEGALSVVMQENLTGMRVVRAFGQEAQEMDKFDQKNGEFVKHYLHMNRLLSRFWSITDFLIMFQSLLTAVVGCVFCVQGTLSVGMVLTFISYTSTLLFPLRNLGRLLADMGKTSVALSRIDEILSAPIEQSPPDALRPEIHGDIEFSHVSLSYEEQEVLHDISFSVKAGQTVGILGATGSGKSSLVQLLQRLYDPQDGTITIDGVDIRKIDLKWLRKNVGIVLQEPFLYSRSILENIRITNPCCSEREVMQAARIAQIDSLATEYENGFATMVGERGVTLSGGQQQRVAIARMLLQNAPIMIFDDSLSALDTETDAAVRRALKEQRHGQTTFLISHRITTLYEADLILVLANGRIVQRGTHQSLVQENGPYRTIWEIYGQIEKNEQRGQVQ